MAQKKIPGRVFCNKNQITKWQRNSTECLECLNCRRGKGSTHPCGTVLKTPSELNKPLLCERCGRGKTFSSKRSNKICKPCKKCQKNHRVIKNCTRRSDTVCGSCKPNYYEKIDEMGIKTCESAPSNTPIKTAQGKTLPKPSSSSRRVPTSTSTSPPSTDVVNDGTIIPTSNAIYIKDAQPLVVVHNKNQIINSSGGTVNVLAIAIAIPVVCIVLLAGIAIARWRKTKRKNARSRVTGRKQNNNESCAVEMEPPAAAGRQQQNVGEPSVHVELHSASSGLLVEQPTTTDHCRENNGVQTPQEVLSHTADQLDCTCQSVNKAKIAGGTDKSCIGASPSISPQGHQDIDVDTCLSECQSKERFERMERSTKVSKYLNRKETHFGKAYENICDAVNALSKNRFTAIACSLGVLYTKIYEYHSQGKGDFDKVLQCLITEKTELKLEDLAEVFEKKGYASIASICREEDRRVQEN